MSTRPRLSSSLGIYHVVYRGINKQRIFEDAEDYEKYLSILRMYQPVCGYKLIAYCLMSNHIHLLIKPGEVPLPRIFQRISPSFVYWYNKKYQRVGSLFQARFKSRPINTRSQLLIVARYIHQNPVKAAVCNHPGNYNYSSFRGYFSNDLIDSELILSEISKDDFYSFNCEENDDLCLDIDDELPRLNDELAAKIMKKLSGCSNVTEFQALNVSKRNEVILNMHMARVSSKQASRITGVSYGVIRKVVTQAVHVTGRVMKPNTRAIPLEMDSPGRGYSSSCLSFQGKSPGRSLHSSGQESHPQI